MDIEDMAGKSTSPPGRPVAHSSKRKRGNSPAPTRAVATSWREALGPPPAFGTTKVLLVQ